MEQESRKFIYNFDFLSGTPNIFISVHKNYSTLIGLVSTFGIIIIGLSYTIYSLYFFISNRDMTLVEINDNFITKDVKIPLNEILFAFNVFNVSIKYEYQWGKEINVLFSEDVDKKPLNQNYTVILYYINPNTKEIINKYYLETEYCEIGKNIDKAIIDKYNFTDYKNFLCLSRNFDFNIIINKTHSVNIDIVISTKAENEDGFFNKIVSENDSVIISEGRYLEFQFYSQNDIISKKDKLNPIKFRKNYFNYEIINPGIYDLHEMKAQYNDFLSDNGYLLKKEEKFNGISLDSFNKKTLTLNSVKSVKDLLYYQLKYSIDSDSIKSYERNYKKLPNLIADIMSIISLLFTISQFLVSFFSKNYLESTIISEIIRQKINLEPENKNRIKIFDESKFPSQNEEIIFKNSSINN